MRELVDGDKRPKCPFCGRGLWWRELKRSWGCVNPNCILSTKQATGFIREKVFGKV